MDTADTVETETTPKRKMPLFQIDDKHIFDSDQLVIYEDRISKIILNNPGNDLDFEEIKSICDAEPNNIPTFTIVLTNNCNLRCRYCSENSLEGSKDLDYSKAILGLEEALVKYTSCNIKAGFKDPFILLFTGGGEPTYNWQLFEKTVRSSREYLKKSGIPFRMSLTTNGTITDSERLDFIIDNFERIVVSYDGTDELQNTNRPYAGNGRSSDDVEHAIIYITDKKKKITVQSTLWVDELCDLEKIADNLLSIVDASYLTWSINPVFSVGRASRKFNSACKTNFFTRFEEVRRYVEDKYDFHSIRSPILDSKPIDHYCGGIFCKHPALCLYPNGVMTCCMDYKDIDYTAKISNGDVSYNKQYNNELLTFYRDRYCSVECRGCIAYRSCRGGCPARLKNLNECAADNFRWECDAKKAMWSHILSELIGGRSSYGWYTERSTSVDNAFVMKWESDEVD